MNSYGECREIVELDLDPIKVKLMHKESGEGWTLEQANIVEAEYRRYLYLMKAFPGEAIAPGTDVDTFWHYHILDTSKYAVDCQEVFGYFVHHFPYIGLRGEDDMVAHERLDQRMRTIYEMAFGETFPSGRLVSAPKTSGAYAAKAEGMAFSASPASVRAAAGNDIAFSAAPGRRDAASSDIAFSAAPGGRPVAASSDIAFSASPVGKHADINTGIANPASSGPVYMTRFGPAAQTEPDSADPDSSARPGDTASSARLGNADGELVASDDLFSIRPRLPEPIAA